MNSFQSIDDVVARLAATGYIADRSLATTIFLADRLEKPILAEGPAGVGKTELAKSVAHVLGAELHRLQCYEGLDEAKTLYEWEYAKQLLYTQILRDKIGEVVAGAATLPEAVDRIAAQEDAFFSERFLLQRPLLRAITAERRAVLLIDEVDRAEAELEAFFLEVLAEFQVSVPELGTLTARHRPLVVLTSNNTRELSDALRRRCLHLWLDFPSAERELAIVRSRVPGIEAALSAEVVRVVQAVRALDLKKKPSVAETIDWARALVVLNADRLDAELARDTLNLLLKYEGDLATAAPKLPGLLASK
ncbi:MAG TPA: MoxR family ATPase [Haliangiales bacterium]|nr:MoxR family ATPase [Haliangiales bacterium]